MPSRFSSRSEAGRLVAARLREYGGRRDVVVLALPTGALAVGAALAAVLDAPLDVVVVRRLLLPGGGGHVGSIVGGRMLLNEGLIDRLHLPRATVQNLAAVERWECGRAEARYREGRSPAAVVGRTVVLVDDGLADPLDLAAAARALREQGAARVVLAFPAIAQTACAVLAGSGEEVVSVEAPPAADPAAWYADRGTLDEPQVRALLAPRASRPGPEGPRGPGAFPGSKFQFPS